MRYAIEIEYDGTPYHGWQRQAGVNSIQAEIEWAISQVADQPVEITCAGRTDKGVHALGQIAHFDTEVIRTDFAWLKGVNHYLPPSINLNWIKPVKETFHARFSATARRYLYFLYVHPIRPSLMRHRVTWQYRPLDIDKMREAATYLIGEHDFISFRGKDCQAKTTLRNMHHLNIIEKAPLLILDVKANAFLHHMVRNITGALIEVGQKRHSPAWIKEIMLAKTRCYGAMTAPATGLHFLAADYPAEFGIIAKNDFLTFPL